MAIRSTAGFGDLQTLATEGTRLEFRAEGFNLSIKNLRAAKPGDGECVQRFTVGTYNNPGAIGGSSRSMQLGVRFIF